MVSPDVNFYINNWLFKDVINNKWTCSKPSQFVMINFVKNGRGRMVVGFTLTH